MRERHALAGQVLLPNDVVQRPRRRRSAAGHSVPIPVIAAGLGGSLKNKSFTSELCGRAKFRVKSQTQALVRPFSQKTSCKCPPVAEFWFVACAHP